MGLRWGPWGRQPQFWYVMDVEGNPIEADTDIQFDKVDWAHKGLERRILQRIRSRACPNCITSIAARGKVMALTSHQL
jgi:hypothetical protein